MARRELSMGEEKILNECPICGAKLEYIALYQYELAFDITKAGRLTKRHKRKADIGPMECGFITCTNRECDFLTNCDFEAENHRDIKIFQEGYTFKYTEEEE